MSWFDADKELDNYTKMHDEFIRGSEAGYAFRRYNVGSKQAYMHYISVCQKLWEVQSASRGHKRQIMMCQDHISVLDWVNNILLYISLGLGPDAQPNYMDINPEIETAEGWIGLEGLTIWDIPEESVPFMKGFFFTCSVEVPVPFFDDYTLKWIGPTWAPPDTGRKLKLFSDVFES